jgi:hypothetical protein
MLDEMLAADAVEREWHRLWTEAHLKEQQIRAAFNRLMGLEQPLRQCRCRLCTGLMLRTEKGQAHTGCELRWRER